MKNDAQDEEHKKSADSQAASPYSYPSEASAAFGTAILDIFAYTAWHPSHTKDVAIEGPPARLACYGLHRLVMYVLNTYRR
jgi:hypothetical protein